MSQEPQPDQSDVRSWFWRRANLSQRLANLESIVRRQQVDLTALQTAVSNLVADQQKLNSDFAAFLRTVTPVDPAQQAAVDALTAQINSSDTALKAIDAQMQPPAPPAPPSA